MAQRPQVGALAPDFSLPIVGGGEFHSGDMRGKRWLLSFQRYAT